MASLGWIDFSIDDRNRVGSVLDLLRPEGMVDELGIGTLRDALANELFPGISTIQTRAKYFFIIPYILYDYQLSKPTQRKSKTAGSYLEDNEYEVMWKLAEKYEYKEGNGVIGISKRKPNKIVRRPSAIYWNGIYTYRFIDTKGLGVESFLRQAKPTMTSLLSSIQQGDDGTEDDQDAEHENAFNIRIPFRSNWREDLTLDLEKQEAEFFKDQIITLAKGKLIGMLLLDAIIWKAFSVADTFRTFVQTAVKLPIADTLKSVMVMAHDFSELMYGAHIAYNCLLQRRLFNNNLFDQNWDNWLAGIQNNMLDYKNFDPNQIIGYSMNTRHTTQQFMKDWWYQTQSGFNDLAYRDKLIEMQEAVVKGNKARLRWNKTDDIKENKWVGLGYLDYRFNQAKTILSDIQLAQRQ